MIGRVLRLRRMLLSGCIGTITVVALAAPASAYYATTGTGAGSVNVGALSAPTLVSATPGAGTVALSWSTVTPPDSGAVSYYVQRNGATAGGNCPSAAAPSTVTSCTDSGLSAGTYQYTVTAVWRTWTATSTASAVTVTTGAADHFVLGAATTTPTAGTADNLTITVKDAANNTVTAYTGVHTLTFSGAHIAPDGTHNPTVTNSSGLAVSFGSATAISFTNGVATVSGADNGLMTLYDAETTSIVVSDGTISNGAGLSVTVGASSAASLSLAAATATPAAGVGDNLTITARDAFANTATGYAGTRTLTFSGASTIGSFSPTVTNSSAVAVPFGSAAALSFTAGVASVSGTGNGVMTLYKAETASIVVSDGTISNGSGLSVTVSPGPSAKVAFSQQPSSSTGGVAFPTQPSVAVLDQFGNTATTDTSAVTLTITSGTGTSGATLTCATNPLHVSGGLAAFSGCSVDKAGTAYTLTASDGSLASAISTGFTVSVGPASKLAFTQQPAGAQAGVAFTTQPAVAVEDAGGNLVSTASNSVTLTITSGTGTSGATLTCTTNPLSASAGAATFSGCAINKAGSGYTLTATATGLSSATTGAFTVIPVVTAAKVTSQVNGTGGSNTTTTGSFTSTSGTTYLVLIQHQDGAKTGIAAAVSGTPLTGISQVGTTNNFHSNSYLYAFVATGTGSTGTVSATFSGTSVNNQATLVEVIALSGNNTTTPIAQSNTTGTGTSTTASATLTSPNGQNGEIALVGVQGTGGAGTTITAPSGYTQLDHQFAGTGGGWTTGVYVNSSAKSSSSFTLAASHPWGTIALEINHG